MQCIATVALVLAYSLLPGPLLQTLPKPHLEGVISVPAQWGPLIYRVLYGQRQEQLPLYHVQVQLLASTRDEFALSRRAPCKYPFA